jgi:hypothetical protein
VRSIAAAAFRESSVRPSPGAVASTGRSPLLRRQSIRLAIGSPAPIRERRLATVTCVSARTEARHLRPEISQAVLPSPAERQAYQRASCVIWIRLPQVSFSMAMVEPVTLVGGMVNSAPRALMRSYSAFTSSV